MDDQAHESLLRVSSRTFISRLKQVLALRDFIVRELSQDQKRESGDILSLNSLYGLEFHRSGRAPSADEWGLLEERFFRMNLLLDREARKKFALRQYPTLVIHVAVYCLAISLAALFFGVYPELIPLSDGSYAQAKVVLPCFVIWNICLGALGSIAFISVNALSMQADVTFDITNVRFVVLRIILGSLFGVLIALPVGYDGFFRFCTDLAKIASAGAVTDAKIYSTQALYLLMPFLVGFSASLFMTIISRLISFVQSLFGVPGGQHGVATPTPTRSIMG